MPNHKHPEDQPQIRISLKSPGVGNSWKVKHICKSQRNLKLKLLILTQPQTLNLETLFLIRP